MKREKHFDVHFVASDSKGASKIIPAHMMILADASDVFEAMFYGTGNQMAVEKNSDGLRVVRIDDIVADVLDFAFDVVYGVSTCKFELSEDSFEDVAYVAEKYDISILRRRCDIFLSLNVRSATNPIKFLYLARKHSSAEIQAKMLNSICEECLSVGTILKSKKYLDVDMVKTILNAERKHYLDSSSNDWLIIASICRAIDASTNTENEVSFPGVREILRPLKKDVMAKKRFNNCLFRMFWPKDATDAAAGDQAPSGTEETSFSDDDSDILASIFYLKSSNSNFMNFEDGSNSDNTFG